MLIAPQIQQATYKNHIKRLIRFLAGVQIYDIGMPLNKLLLNIQTQT